MADDPDDLERVIGEVARSSRREEVTRKAETALPDFILSIEQAEASITIKPTMLPYKQVEGAKLLHLLKNSYSLEFQAPQMAHDAVRWGFNPASVTEAELLDLVLAQNDVYVRFGNGRFPTGPNSFVVINSVLFTDELILANVTGRTDIAEVLISELFELLYQASGAAKRFESDEVQRSIQLKSYGTRTKVNFGESLLSLINPGLQEFLTKNVVEGERFGAGMMSLSSFDRFQERANVLGAIFLDELDFAVLVHDARTERYESRMVRISVTARDEMGRGIADVITEMHYDRHVAFIAGLLNAIKKKHK